MYLSQTVVALLATLHPKRSGPPPSNNAQLDALLNECFLREEYRKEIHRLHDAEKSSNPYEAECQNWIGLLLGCYTEEISIADGDQLEAAIMKALGDVHVARGETPNMGSVPPDNFTSVAMWHYCPKDKAQQKYFTEEDAKTHNRTHREQACLHAYNVKLPKSVAGENKVTPRDGYNSVSHNIDCRTHCFNIETSAPNRAKLCEDECDRVCVVFGVQRVTLDLPGVFQVSSWILHTRRIIIVKRASAIVPHRRSLHPQKSDSMEDSTKITQRKTRNGRGSQMLLLALECMPEGDGFVC